MPIFTPTELAELFVGGLLLGFLFALAYDGLRILRILMGRTYGSLGLPLPPTAHDGPSTCRLLDLLIHLEDIGYFLAVGAVSAVYLAAENHGLIRWPFPVGVLIGFAAWRLTLGRLLIAASSAIAALLHFALSWLLWAISRPIVGLGRLTARGIASLAQAVRLPLYTRRTMRRFRRRLACAFTDFERRDKP